MFKLIVDTNSVKNEITQIHDEAFKALNAQSDNERRNALHQIVEKLRTLKANMSPDQFKVEIK